MQDHEKQDLPDETHDIGGNRFHNTPLGWTSRIMNTNNGRALGLEAAEIVTFEHGSAETLNASLAAAYGAGDPWFGYYRAPTEVMGKYDRTEVRFAELDLAVNAANMAEDRPDPQASAYPPGKVLTVATRDFVDREPEIAALMSKLHCNTDEMSALLAWKEAHNATNEEAAVHFLQNNPEQWADWLNDEARGRLVKLLQ
ncbi:glycine betaine ABC transporter substrate-binding protein [Pontibaca salina]|uniref:ABC-type glycine betaine transport system substrate-binding domain-containing protein n=1 Tax=Pontibaca salina TaxID=2795731 RepID=A0A934HLZ0_9RHOB|nr:glycine betaine ABC transporter substrate-binding protein [Pontibaca salina]MBI6630664.1 hypothetical protein [Pontibaca salina]